MIVTEEEAKTKWCPHAVASHTDPRAGFKKGDGDASWGAIDKVHPCIASQCMSWRWCVGVYDTKHERFLGPGETYSTSERGRYVEREDSRGFCGLAGQP